MAKRCRGITEKEKSEKRPIFIVNLLKLLIHEIEADRNYYNAHVSQYSV